MSTDEIETEQRVIDDAYVALDAMAERARGAFERARHDAHLTDAVDAAAIQHVLAARLQGFAPSKAPLTFGRIDEADATYYIGRRHVEDAHGDPIVVDWRAPVSAPFYRATWADPLGLDRRRRFALEGRTLVGTFDEDFADPDSEGGAGGVPDPLLAELDRGRTGTMRDIVSTIQAEQDVVIRAELEELLIVQGGPGTGKTAVGLHRAAFLLYANREHFARRKLLVVGPNRLFLAYISDVLPSLGETAVVQATIETLNSRAFPVRAEESGAAARLKGDARMAELLRRATTRRIADPDQVRVGPDLDVMTAFGGATVPAAVVADELADVKARVLALNTGREVFREHVIAQAWRARSQRFDVSPEQQHAFIDDLRAQSSFKAKIDRLWPAMSAPAMVRSLFSSARALKPVAADLYGPEELSLLVRPATKKLADERWTRADLAILDDLQDRLVGDVATFGHVVVDEAQDLSAMELRMIARRSPTRSITVLGDLAQSTGVAGQESWELALAQLGHRRGDAAGREPDPAAGRTCVLSLGYRVPENLIDYANRLLAVASPGLAPGRSVRVGGEAPDVRNVSHHELLDAAVDAARALCADVGLVGVLAAPSMLDALLASFAHAGIDARDGRSTAGLLDGITVLAGEASKGLEFDATVVVEPRALIAEHAAGERAGYRTLFVSLTRATQRVVIVHAQGLPAELGDTPGGATVASMTPTTVQA